MTTAFAIAAGGLGAVLRYLVSVSAQRRWPERPIGTAVVNVAGAIALGALLAAGASDTTVRDARIGSNPR
jgi:fluoride ion exporter CrcB/FEX